MQVRNVKDLTRWISKLWRSKRVFYRYESFPIAALDMTWEKELKKHARLYEQDPRHFTFHHIRLLFHELKHNKIKYPLVGSFHDNNIQINPGGSRLMVAKKIGLTHAPLDLICREQNAKLNINYTLIDSVEKFLEPYAHIDSDVHIDLHTGKKFYYEINFHNHFHWSHDDTDEWINQKQHIKCSNPLDYYFI